MPPSVSILTHDLSEAMLGDTAVVASELTNKEWRGAPRAAEIFGAGLDPLAAGCVVARLEIDSPQPGALLERIAERRSALTVVYLLEGPATKSVVDVMRSGAFDVLDWPADRQRLGVSLEAALTASLEKQSRLREAQQAERLLAELTPVEREVLQLMLAGKVNKSIAARLGIALRTVEARRKRIFAKLGTRSLAELAGVLNRANLLAPSGRPPTGPTPLR